MVATSFVRWSGMACMLAGLAMAAFVLIHPWDQLVGAEIARSARWRIAHTLHFVGALFAIPGLLGLFVFARERLGALGIVGMIVSLIGTAMFLGTGMITAFIWPMLAVHAPATVELGGPIFHAPVSAIAFLITAATMIVGHLLFGARCCRPASSQALRLSADGGCGARHAAARIPPPCFPGAGWCWVACSTARR